jgi:hypothetical protein
MRSAIALTGAALAAAGLAASAQSRPRAAVPAMPPASDFSARVTNEWFPLTPGARWVYTGVKDGQPTRDVVTVLHDTTTIDGVPCAVVHDRLYSKGRLSERTTDWYSQDAGGNVWYLGEDTAELDARGHVTSTEGSWRTGKDGARAGIYVPAHPHVGQSYLQEYLKGQAEDRFRILSLFGTVTGAAGTNALLTRETSALEPDVVDHKLYVRGVGVVLEQSQKGPNERNELVSLTRGR